MGRGEHPRQNHHNKINTKVQISNSKRWGFETFNLGFNKVNILEQIEVRRESIEPRINA